VVSAKFGNFSVLVFIGFFASAISLFDAQGSRVIIVIVHVGAVKIYVVSAVEALKEKKSGYETQFTTKIGGKN
jgi:NADH:ubiquinone oxidoreductase subunit 6 (subunit J)